MTIHLVTLTPIADADLDEITAWLAAESPARAALVLARIEAAILSLARFPDRHARAPEGDAAGVPIRHVSVSDYRVLYCVRGRSVVVLRVGHGARRSLPIDKGS
jgi:plasmid stabilization system protein ParE